MNRLFLLMPLGLIMLISIFTASTAFGETVDEKVKKGIAAGTINVVTREHTRDACDKGCDVTFTSTTDGDVVVKAGETKFFKIKKDDDYTLSGGYYWKCCNAKERSRIKGATYIKAVRTKDTGAFDQYWVEIELTD